MSQPSQPVSRRPLPTALWLFLVIAMSVVAALAWKSLSKDRDDAVVDIGPEALDARLLQLETLTATLRRNQESITQRLTDTSARTGLLRDEVLGITQRSALIEDSVRQLSRSQHDGVNGLRLDEVELLLTLAQQRLHLSGDLPGAIRATELADGVLQTQHGPALFNLRQALAQELTALKANGPLPQTVASAALDALESALPQLTNTMATTAGTSVDASRDSGFSRLLDSLVQIRASGEQNLLAPTDRLSGEASLRLDITLARTALDRHDQAAFKRSVDRIDQWLQRLYADSPTLRQHRAKLSALSKQSLDATVPMAGSALEQLHALQRRHPRGS